MATYLASLRRVAKLPLRLILSGHGPPVEHPAEAIEAYIERRLEREAEIVRLLGEGPALISDLAVQLYRGRGLPAQMQWFIERTVEAHLIKLCEEGRAHHLPEGEYSLA
jgi:glyoxylase-like metal-dependent hydrolase (beta-lactamase superfamily II)